MRLFIISAFAVLLGLVAGGIAWILTHLIGFFTNLFFFHRLSTEFIDPGQAPNWGPWVIAIPVVGGLIVGVMARWGSKAIRGHGIPEAMEQILTNESKIPYRIVFLKPLSAAVAIGSGGPFGAEGPIIATGGALGSWLGQKVKTNALERKTLLAAGAAAGMTATFGSPISAVLLAVELLLFEFRARTIVPVALACAAANAARMAFVGNKPAFAMPALLPIDPPTLLFYIALGVIIGFASIGVTKLVYWVEDMFDELPIHWMWWPALGGIAVGLIGYFFPRTLGVGYANIDAILSGEFATKALALFCLMKFISWCIALGSGTSGGTLAPIFTIGGGLGTLLGTGAQALGINVDPRAAALVGMAALFAGASRALLASVVFAFETTGQQLGLLPLLAGCAVAYLISSTFMRTTIMTEKIHRRGVRVPADYIPDHLTTVLAKQFCQRPLATLNATDPVADPATTHTGYPVVDDKGELIGVVTKKQLAQASGLIGDLIGQPPITITGDHSLRDAADLMTARDIGRVVIVENKKPVGIITRSDLLKAHSSRLSAEV